MSTSVEQEQARILREQIQKEKVSTFDFLRELARMSPEQLQHCGAKTMEQALLNAINNSAKKIEKMIVAHERKFPDK